MEIQCSFDQTERLQFGNLLHSSVWIVNWQHHDAQMFIPHHKMPATSMLHSARNGVAEYGVILPPTFMYLIVGFDVEVMNIQH